MSRKRECLSATFSIFASIRKIKYLFLLTTISLILGLKTFGIDLKVASKFFGTKFACGASITGDDEIVIQGDCKDDLFDIIPEKWPEVSTQGLNSMDTDECWHRSE